MKLYSCRFAPCAATRRDVIRVAQRVMDHGEPVYEAFDPLAFRAAGVKASEVPILLDHDVTKRAGTVTAIVAHKDWHHADFVLDGPYASEAADWIARSGKVSPGFSAARRDPSFVRVSPYHAPTNWYREARLDEISLAPQGSITWYRNARVTGSYESKVEPAKPKPAVSAPVRRPSTRTTRKPDPYEHVPVGEEFTEIGGGRVLLVRSGKVVAPR